MQPEVINRITTNSNKFGITLFYLTLTNAEFDYSQLSDNNNMQKNIGFYSEDVVIDRTMSSKTISIFNEGNVSDETVILNFVNKLVSSSKDIDPDINQLVNKHFMDLI